MSQYIINRAIDQQIKKRYWRILFLLPALAPVVLYPALMFLDNPFPSSDWLYNNIAIYKSVSESTGNKGVTFWGYVFSLIHLTFMLPYMLQESKKKVYLMGDIKMTAKQINGCFAAFFLIAFYFFNFVDLRAGGKFSGMLSMGVHCWPLFYYFFIFPLYLIFMFTFNVFNIKQV
ncbi:hypothetical protein HR060_04860 [Catenovulum sp. SM1970]|uniref:hypothetical protein n=1 Tax=Marinifaba aquimaris TaxID=2741323 RepID=UPI0015722F31|nr:hypothetical protein [Marinifaba aquimaris]NTS76192.1 hypothetical protein [Marinifaba aquimaris]